MSIGNCPRCGGKNDDENEYCKDCRSAPYRFLHMTTTEDMEGIYDEPMLYECAMCGMEIVSYEVVRGQKYCYSCAATERYG